MALQAAHRRAQGSFTPVRASARPTLGRLARRGAVRVVAFKESQAVDDWRIQVGNAGFQPPCADRAYASET